MTTAHVDVDVRRVAGRIGAEMVGIGLGPDLEPAVVSDIRAALLQHRVLFFRGQHDLDDESQAGFARLLGSLTRAHPTVPSHEKDANVLPIDSERGQRANSWHTDVTFVDSPPSISVLRAVSLPPFGGDTAWANTVAAYTGLPAELRQLADQLWALHTNDYDYATWHSAPVVSEQTRHYREVFTATVYETHHPVVRVHPETGERALLLGHFAQRILGLSGGDSRHVIELLQSHVTRQENTVRWQWRPGDVAIWDNRSTQHYAIADYDDHPRLLHRVTLTGDVPVSVTGKPSVAQRGDATTYSLAATG